MKTLISTSIVTGIALALNVIYMIWSEPEEFVMKIFVTLLVLFVAQVVAYLVMRDIKEESQGKDDGTIAH